MTKLKISNETFWVIFKQCEISPARSKMIIMADSSLVMLHWNTFRMTKGHKLNLKETAELIVKEICYCVRRMKTKKELTKKVWSFVSLWGFCIKSINIKVIIIIGKTLRKWENEVKTCENVQVLTFYGFQTYKIKLFNIEFEFSRQKFKLLIRWKYLKYHQKYYLFLEFDRFWERKSTYRKAQKTSQVQEIISLEFFSIFWFLLDFSSLWKEFQKHTDHDIVNAMKWTIEQIVTFFLSSKIFCLSLRWIEYEEGPSIICYLCCYCTLFPRTLIDFLLFSLPSFLTSFFLLLSPPAWQSIIGQFANCIFGEIENKENKSKIRTIFQKGKVNN